MNGKSEVTILVERAKLIGIIEKYYKLTEPTESIYVLDSFITGAEKVNPLFCLGHAIEALSQADIAVFDIGWEDSRGCKIEHECCVSYGIPIRYVKKEELTGTMGIVVY